MAVTPEILQGFIDRAASDPEFLSRLVQDPVATVQAEGLQLSDAELTDLLNSLGSAPGVQQNLEEMVQNLDPRVSHSGLVNLKIGGLQHKMGYTIKLGDIFAAKGFKF